MRVPTYQEFFEALEVQVKAALAIHAPCHTDKTERWGCLALHYDMDVVTGIPETPAVCMSCTYDDRTVTYPCPTAIALGVAPAPSKEN